MVVGVGVVVVVVVGVGVRDRVVVVVVVACAWSCVVGMGVVVARVRVGVLHGLRPRAKDARGREGRAEAVVDVHTETPDAQLESMPSERREPPKRAP